MHYHKPSAVIAEARKNKRPWSCLTGKKRKWKKTGFPFLFDHFLVRQDPELLLLRKTEASFFKPDDLFGYR